MHRQGLTDLIQTKYKKDQQLFGIEIGCFQGELARHLLNEFPNLYLTSIDPYIQWTRVLKNVEPFEHRFQVIQLHSDVACNLLSIQFDFIFIDGDHSYEQCRKDIVNYMRLLKPGGIMSGHNYHKESLAVNGFAGTDSSHPGVHKAVDEIYGSKVRLAPDFIWYV